MIRQAGSAFALTFRGPGAPLAYAITFGLGTALTAFYLVMLPSSAVGGFSLVALRYLTPALSLSAASLGYGFALTIAINAGSSAQRSRTAEAAGIGGLLAAILPGSLCCTSIVPSALAALGASVPTVLGTTGKIQSIFGLYESAFIAASIAGVALSIVLAAHNRVSHCALQSP
jgi:hypothetical protein